MPQLDFATWPPQLIWLAITFGILYLVISKFALPKIGGTIESRQNRIASDLDEAQRLKDDSEKAIAAYEAALAEAKAKAHGIAQETRDTLKAEIEAERAALDAQLNERLAKAEASIAATKAEALKSVEQVASDAAGAIVSRLIGSKTTAAAVKKAIADAK
ncbi:MAG: F0F1 ATP synthase subunit B' [Alphaproteobacteria bacterium]|nr:F0F1 ATP synthase subunit B' [Alphaproteobacteria bacterium]